MVTSASSYYKKRKITIKMHVLRPGRTRQFLCILRKNLSSFPSYKCARFFSHQILSSITKLHRRHCPALEQDKFLSGVKTVQILQFARHDLKKKFLSAPTITKLKIWLRQILSRFLDGPNKFCQSSASGPLVNFLQCRRVVVGQVFFCSVT